MSAACQIEEIEFITEEMEFIIEEIEFIMEEIEFIIEEIEFTSSKNPRTSLQLDEGVCLGV